MVDYAAIYWTIHNNTITPCRRELERCITDANNQAEAATHTECYIVALDNTWADVCEPFDIYSESELQTRCERYVRLIDLFGYTLAEVIDHVRLYPSVDIQLGYYEYARQTLIFEHNNLTEDDLLAALLVAKENRFAELVKMIENEINRREEDLLCPSCGKSLLIGRHQMPERCGGYPGWVDYRCDTEADEIPF